MADFVRGIRQLRSAGLGDMPLGIASAAAPTDLAAIGGADSGQDQRHLQSGWACIARSLASLQEELRSALGSHSEPAEQALAYVDRTYLKNERHCIEVMLAALGIPDPGLDLPLYLVPSAPFPPGCSFLMEGGSIRAGYLDYRRYSGPALLESIMMLAGWALLALTPAETSLSRMLAAGISGGGRHARRLRALTIKMLIAMTAEHVVRYLEPGYRGTTETFGLNLRYRRLHPELILPWEQYLTGHASRASAIAMITARLNKRPERWFIEQIDAASLAADFYLLEWMASEADRAAARILAYWEPRLADDFARHLDVSIAAELCHYDRIATPSTPRYLRDFMHSTCDGNAMLRWPSVRREFGLDAYSLAEDVFAGPGKEYGGGPAWAPITRAVGDYNAGRIPARIFIDMCFTLEHNNGCVFDKFFDTWSVTDVLDAQARGDLQSLAAHASPEVRRLLRRHLQQSRPAHGGLWWGPDQRYLPADLASWEERYGWTRDEPARPGAPGRAGCGSSREQDPPDEAEDPRTAHPWLNRDPPRRPRLREVPVWESVTTTVHTSLGPIELSLFPRAAPMAVGVFVQLARGEIAWRDPLTGTPGSGPFYDDTAIHRLIPDFLIQAGDRAGTGTSGPGFRFEEETGDLRFDEPYRVAMFNMGRGTSGSQFFITLAPAEHLDGQYTIIGTVRDEASREVAHRVSRAGPGAAPRITRVDVTAVAPRVPA